MRERLSPIEAIMWRAGHDATLKMTVGNVVILDRVPDQKALAERLAAAADVAPRLRWRLDDPTRTRSRPSWVDGHDDDVADHIRHLMVPAPGELRQALDLVGLIEPAPFDPSRSPWDVTLIEGLAGGRAALYFRADHVLTDGMGGMELVGLLLDEPSQEAAADAGAGSVQEAGNGAGSGSLASEADDGRSPVVSVDSPVGGRKPGTFTMSIDFTSAARPVVAGLAAARSIDPFDTVLRSFQRGLDTASSVSRQLVVTGGPLSPLTASRSAASHFEAVSVSGARAAALALGGSRNDLLVAASAVGLGRYHERLGIDCPELRIAMPTIRHREAELGGNWFAPTRVQVPTSGGHPGPLFGVVADRLARARHEPAVGLTTSLASAINRLPNRLLLSALQGQAHAVDFVATALPGLRGPRQICGAEVVGSYPFGPRMGRLMNVSALGNDDRLDLGIGIDAAAITDAPMLVECLVEAFGQFVEGDGPAARAAERGSRSAAAHG